jgi:hypothetical protein
MHWLIAPSYLFNALNISEFGEPPGGSPRQYIPQLFHKANSLDVYPTFYPQLAHGGRKESSWETHRIVQKRAQDLCRKGLRPPISLGL